jgi:oligopeptidase A
MNNPILEQIDLPIFDQIKAEHIYPAITSIINENKTKIKEIEDYDISKIDYKFVDELSLLDYKLSNAWSQIGHLNSVMNSDEYRGEYNKCRELITDYYSSLSQNTRIFNMYKVLKKSTIFESLNAIQQKIINDEIKDFKLGGVDLDEDKKSVFKELQSKLAKLASKFEENVLDETNNYALNITDDSLLDGIPEDILESAKSLAKENDQKGHTFTLHFPSYVPVLQYAKNRNLRKDLYEAYAKKASEFSDKKFDNTTIIKDILNHRASIAKLLGFNNFAELSIDRKMASNPDEVCSFLRDLSSKAKPYGLKDLEELKEAAKKDGVEDLEAWDVAFYSEAIKQEKYNINDQEIKQFFPENKVIEGLFNVIKNLYDIDIVESKASIWHNDVKYFELFQNNKIIGSFYLDLYARKNKRGGAWMDECISKTKFNLNIDYPVAYLTCNFSSPLGNKSALFTHDEVITLFHECGHGLHHLLTEISEFNVSGIKGVEWDAVELPSQFMENFCWDWSVIKNMTQHIQTKESMPKELFNKLIASKNFQSGMQSLRQIEFALFDMLIHMEGKPDNLDVISTLESVRDEVAVVHPPHWNRFPHSFSHIFAGGYAAGYYSYKWAEVLSADVFEEFENNGVLSKDIGARFRKEILSVGGSRSAKESFIKFKGREPSVEALLRHNGLAA